VISTSEGNDDMIIPRQENPNHALMRVGNDGNSIFHARIGLHWESGPETHAQHSWHLGWQVRVQWCRYRGGTAGLTTSNQLLVSISHIISGSLLKFHLFQNRAKARTAFNSAKPQLDWQL